MSDPFRYDTTFIRRPTRYTMARPGQKVHVNFRRSCSCSCGTAWNIYQVPEQPKTSKAGLWGFLGGAVLGILGGIFGNKNSAQTQVVNQPSQGNQNQPQDNSAAINDRIDQLEQNMNNLNSALAALQQNSAQETAPVAESPAAESPAPTAPPTAPPPPAAPEVNPKSPAGWYRDVGATRDKVIQKLTPENIEVNRGNESAAKFVMDEILKTKPRIENTLTEKGKEKLLMAIIRSNTAIFDSQGNLKPNADMTTLNIPTAQWIDKNIEHKNEISNTTSDSLLARMLVSPQTITALPLVKNIFGGK